MKKQKKLKLSPNQQTIIILVAIFLIMLVLNVLTPLIADDYSYSFNKSLERITSFKDIIDFQFNYYYFNWGGRCVAHTLAQIFLIFPKGIFSIINSILYVALIYLIYLHAKGINKNEKPELLVLIHLALWFLLPVFGQTCLWLTGACNYLWTMILILLFLLSFRNNKNSSAFKIVGLFFLGVLAGWTNENTAFGLIVIALGIIIADRYIDKKKISKSQISGLIGVITGFIILIIAPGNFIRADELNDSTTFIVKMIKRIMDITSNLFTQTMPLLIITVILISIYIYNKERINKYVYVFLFGGILTAYAMTLSPTFPERAWFGAIIFFIIADLQLIYSLILNKKIFKIITINFIIILSLIYVPQYIDTIKDIKDLKDTWRGRIDYIENAKKDKNTELEFASYYTQNKHNPAYGLVDLNIKDKDWPNESIAKYYNIKTIKAK